MAEKKAKYGAAEIKVLEGLEGVRKRFDVVELSKRIKKKGDVLILSNELKVRPRILNSAVREGRVLSLLPDIQKSKAEIIACLRTPKEIKEFAEKFDFNKISVRQLRKEVRKWRQDIQKDPLILLTQKEHDLIIGSLLGDASIRQRDKNCSFRVAHSFRQKGYLKFKSSILTNFSFAEYYEKKRVINGREIHMIYLGTKTHQVFNYYRNLFYKNGTKIVSEEILNQLNSRSLAIWICDDGSYDNRQGYIVLCTNSYSLEEHKLMKRFFREKFGLDPTIGFRDGKYYYLRFKQEDSKKLIEIVRLFIPESMKYKIGEKNG